MIAPKHKARSPSLFDVGLMTGASGRALAMAELLCGRPAPRATDEVGTAPSGGTEPNPEDAAEKNTSR